jgi:regulator of Ty1 transposition protein 103
VAQLYLANHLLQEGRKKGREFGDEFGRVMGKALKALLASGDDKARRAVERLLEIWESRRVFGGSVMKGLKDTLAKAKAIQLVKATQASVADPRAAAKAAAPTAAGSAAASGKPAAGAAGNGAAPASATAKLQVWAAVIFFSVSDFVVWSTLPVMA